MEGKLYFIDVTMRDGHQCLWSTRMTTEMMTPVLDTVDRVGYAYINILGGAVFDVCVRYLHENPWERIRTICRRMKRTPVDGLTRGQSLYTFELFPDDVVALNMKRLAANGISHVTVYDALNDCRNLTVSVEAAHREGMSITALMVYTVSPVHTDAYYQERTKELVALGADRIGVKDPGGLLMPERAKTLFPAIYSASGGVPLELHSHCQSGFAVEVYEEAMKNGFTHLHTAVMPLANGASLPPIESVEEIGRNLGFKTGIDRRLMKQESDYFKWLAYREKKPIGLPTRHDPSLFEHQVPGGMISNLRSQLRDMGIEHRLEEILHETGQVRKDLGYPILVSPFAQYVVTQAVLNVVQGERYKTVPEEVRKYAMGYYGRLAAQPSDLFMERAGINPQEIRFDRAGSYLEPGIPRLRTQLVAADDEELLLAAFYDESLRKGIRPAPQYRFHTAPLLELIRYVEERVDSTRFVFSFKQNKVDMVFNRQ